MFSDGGGFALDGGPPLPTNDDFEVVLACGMISVGLAILLFAAWKFMRK